MGDIGVSHIIPWDVTWHCDQAPEDFYTLWLLQLFVMIRGERIWTAKEHYFDSRGSVYPNLTNPNNLTKLRNFPDEVWRLLSKRDKQSFSNFLLISLLYFARRLTHTSDYNPFNSIDIKFPNKNTTTSLRLQCCLTHSKSQWPDFNMSLAEISQINRGQTIEQQP